MFNAELPPMSYRRGPRSPEVVEDGDYTLRYTVTTSMFLHCEGQSRKDSVRKPQLLKRKESRRGLEPRSFCVPA